MAVYYSIKDPTVQVEAIKFTGATSDVSAIRTMISTVDTRNVVSIVGGRLLIKTRKGSFHVTKGNYVVRGADDEIFQSTPQQFEFLYNKSSGTLSDSLDAEPSTDIDEYIQVYNRDGYTNRRIRVSSGSDMIIGRSNGHRLRGISVGTNTIVGRRGSGLEAVSVDENTIVGRRGLENMGPIVIEENTVVGRTSGGTVSGISVGEERVLGRRTGGALTGLTSEDIGAMLSIGDYVKWYGTPADNQIAVFRSATEIEGDARLLFTDGVFHLTGNGSTNMLLDNAAIGFAPSGGSADLVLGRWENYFLDLTNWGSGTAADATVFRIFAHQTLGKEATLALVRGANPNLEFLDFYNNGYDGATNFGMRLQKRGTGVYRDFKIDAYDGTTYTNISEILVSNIESGGSPTHKFYSDVEITGSGYFSGTASSFTKDGLYIDYNTGSARIVASDATGGGGASLSFYVGEGGSIELALSLSDTGVIETGNNSPIRHPSFVSGWQGTNWQIEDIGDAEFRNLRVRGGLEVYELILNRLHYQNGGLIIGAGGGKIASVTGSAGSEVITCEDPEGNVNLPFTVGAIVMVQDFDLDRTTVVKKIVRQVDSISTNEITLTTTTGWTTLDDVGSLEAGDEIVAIGHTSNTGLDSCIYLSAVDSGNPFMRVFDGIDAYDKWTLSSKTALKLQIGNLESLAGYDIVPATPGYGMYSDNVFLKGNVVATSGEIGGFTIESVEGIYSGSGYQHIHMKPGVGFWCGDDNVNDAPFMVNYAGVLKATTGLIGGIHIDSNALYTGTKHITDGYSSTGITIGSDGSIHAPNLYIDADGETGIRGTIIYAYQISNDVLIANDGDISTYNDYYTKLKTITLGPNVASGMVLRIYFEMMCQFGGDTVYGRVYMNGNSIGIQRFTTSNVYQSYTEDIPGWSPGDDIELYAYTTDPSNPVYVRNFRVLGTHIGAVNEVTEA